MNSNVKKIMENSKHYPTHPGAENPPTMTCEIPLEEYESLKRENAELKAENERLKSDIADLRDDRKSSQAIIDELNANNAELEANQTWIKPSDKLPNENQEIEFIVQRRLFEGDTGVRLRLLGVYKQIFLNPPHGIFYASAPGWGSEYLPKEVEYWMPKIPMPKAPEEK